MSKSDHRMGLFPALLKHWRSQRGLSQLDLALAADVSSRHISFLETGRSSPSAEMVLRLATTLDVPLRRVNELLSAAGHEPIYAEFDPREGLPEPVQGALRLMKEHHDPFPLLVVDHGYDVVDMNTGALALFGALFGGMTPDQALSLNLVRLTFAPGGANELMVNFHEIGRWLLWRIQREVLADPNDTALRALLEEVLAQPSVSEDWREIDLTTPASPTLVMHLRADELDLRFVAMVTAFQAPQTVMLDELRIETWFPQDEATAKACRELMGRLDA